MIVNVVVSLNQLRAMELLDGYIISSIPVPPPLIQKCLNVTARRIESVCAMGSMEMGFGACAIRVICAACGSVRFLVLQLAKYEILQAIALIEAMMLGVASLKACRWAEKEAYHEAWVIMIAMNALVTKHMMSSLKVLVGARGHRVWTMMTTLGS